MRFNERSERNRERVEYQILKEWETETLFGMVNETIVSFEEWR